MYFYPTTYGIAMGNAGIQMEMVPNYIPFFSTGQYCYNPNFIFPIEEFLPKENNEIFMKNSLSLSEETKLTQKDAAIADKKNLKLKDKFSS